MPYKAVLITSLPARIEAHRSSSVVSLAVFEASGCGSSVGMALLAMLAVLDADEQEISGVNPRSLCHFS